MKLIIEIPEEHELHFEKDKFQSSLDHVAADIDLNIKSGRFGLSGSYELKMIKMLQNVLMNAEVTRND